MGVPAFFRWLTRKYPSVIIECVENKSTDPETGANIYEDASLPNPNGIEFDNLYLDMNGIIHPCTHPEDKPPPKNEDEMMIAIFDCIDRLFAIVRPRKVLYMAIDGVAPRAKMNQQRSRRFRAAKESVEKRLEIERIRSELLAKGCVLPPEKKAGEHFDSNCITPGTPFMEKLSICLHYYIHDRMNNNPAWKGLKVILSDANVPGEGEHKIMDFIRKQRGKADHDPNTHHVLCGADADLIMLGLATHEPNFTIIREEFLPNKPRPCDICQEYGHEMDKCAGLNANMMNNMNKVNPDVPISQEVRFIFVRLSVLREYLKKCLEMPNLPFEYEFERVLDDWVFMCFFVGNDFLPHLPSLEIREGAVDRLMGLYKKCVYKTKGYLTKNGEVDLDSVQLIMTDLGYMEDQIFKERQRREVQYRAREKAKRPRTNEYSSSVLEKSTLLCPTAVGRDSGQSTIKNYKLEAAMARTVQNSQQQNSRKRSANEAGLNDNDDSDDEYKHDEVRLWEDGFKDRYYESKFDVGADNFSFRYSVALQYVRGLCWVLKYYYQGCASWKWYFPYHYAPFASDFINITGLSTSFEKGTKPFNPLEQLMGVFPAASSSHVPEPWAQLMSDPDSPIIDFYPEDFTIDLNGKKFAWQGVALLPFVDEKRLFKALEPYYCKLTKEEIRRNKHGDNRLYIGKLNKKYNTIKVFCKKNTNDNFMDISIDGMTGSINTSEESVPLSETLQAPIKGLQNVTDNDIITVRFKDPIYVEGYTFEAVRLPNAIDPPNVLAPQDRAADYKPQIGFVRNMPHSYIPDSGHRMLNAAIPNNRGSYQNRSYDHRSNQQAGVMNPYLNNMYGNQQFSGSRYNNNYYGNNARNNFRHNNQPNRNYSYNANRAQSGRPYHNRQNRRI